MIAQKTDDEYQEEGLAAIKRVSAEKLNHGLDKIIAANISNLNFKGSATNFRNKILEVHDVLSSGRKGMVNFLNHNKYMNSALKFTDSYISENPEKVAEFVQSIEEEFGIKLAEYGLDKALYDRTLKAIQKTGLIGKESGLVVLADTFMENLPKIAGSIFERDGKLTMTGPAEKIIANYNELGINTEEIRAAYNQGGFVGENSVMEYILERTLPHGLRALRKELDGKFDTEELIKSYKEHGIFGRNGLIDEIFGIALKESNENEIYKNH